MAAPRKRTAPVPAEEVLDFETVANEVVEVAVPEAEQIGDAPEPAETPEQKRIRELTEELERAEERERTNPTADDGRPLPESQLTEEQRQIRELEHRLALKKGKSDGGPTGYEVPTSGDTIHIHFVKDGFTAQGEVWFRGQEVVFDRQGVAYKQTQDRNGNSWVDLAGDAGAQYDRYGDEYFRPGPFRGRKDEQFNDDIAKADARRGLAAPVISA